MQRVGSNSGIQGSGCSKITGTRANHVNDLGGGQVFG